MRKAEAAREKELKEEADRKTQESLEAEDL
jgi:hypothetical protein